MKKLLAVFLLTSVLTLRAQAGVDRRTTQITTNSQTVGIPLGDYGTFEPSWLLISGIPAGSTQTVTYVANGVTGSISAGTTDSVIKLTNVPPMFPSDSFVVAPSATLTTNDDMNVTIIGTVTP